MSEAGLRPVRATLGGLEAIDFPVESPEALVVCCHGYGADASDLAPLAMEIPVSRKVRWIFPDAPQPLGSAPWSGGRQWFPIDEEALLRAQVSGEFRDFAASRPQGIDDAARALRELVAAALPDSGAFVVGGFSQGSMVAIESALMEGPAPAGVFVLSGNLVDEEGTSKRAPARAGTPFFQTHGEMDPMLGFEGAKKLERALSEAGWKGELRPFQGGHGVPPEHLASLGEFIDGAVGGKHG
jgi:phospholipase/carboxylesterase